MAFYDFLLKFDKISCRCLTNIRIISLISLIRINWLEWNPNIFYSIHCIFRPSTIATASRSTLKRKLFCQIILDWVWNQNKALILSSDNKRPAWTTKSLILNWTNFSKIPVIKSSWVLDKPTWDFKFRRRQRCFDFRAKTWDF